MLIMAAELAVVEMIVPVKAPGTEFYTTLILSIRKTKKSAKPVSFPKGGKPSPRKGNATRQNGYLRRSYKQLRKEEKQKAKEKKKDISI